MPIPHAPDRKIQHDDHRVAMEALLAKLESRPSIAVDEETARLMTATCISVDEMLDSDTWYL